MPYSFEHKGRKIDLLIGGTIDRVDIKGDTINIVDYKTGGGKKESKVSLDDIFAHEPSVPYHLSFPSIPWGLLYINSLNSDGSLPILLKFHVYESLCCVLEP